MASWACSGDGEKMTKEQGIGNRFCDGDAPDGVSPWEKVWAYACIYNDGQKQAGLIVSGIALFLLFLFGIVYYERSLPEWLKLNLFMFMKLFMFSPIVMSSVILSFFLVLLGRLASWRQREILTNRYASYFLFLVPVIISIMLYFTSFVFIRFLTYLYRARIGDPLVETIAHNRWAFLWGTPLFLIIAWMITWTFLLVYLKRNEVQVGWRGIPQKQLDELKRNTVQVEQ